MLITVAAKTWEPFGETSLDAFDGCQVTTQLNYILTVVLHTPSMHAQEYLHHVI